MLDSNPELLRLVSVAQRRRIKTEEKAKVGAFVWGQEFIKFLASIAFWPRTILKNRMTSSLTFKSSHGAIHLIILKRPRQKKLSRQGIE